MCNSYALLYRRMFCVSAGGIKTLLPLFILYYSLGRFKFLSLFTFSVFQCDAELLFLLNFHLVYLFWCINLLVSCGRAAVLLVCRVLLRPCGLPWDILLHCSWCFTDAHCMYAKETLPMFCFSANAGKLCWSRLWCFATNCWKLFPGSVDLVHCTTQRRIRPTTHTLLLLQLIQVLAIA